MQPPFPHTVGERGSDRRDRLVHQRIQLRGRMPAVPSGAAHHPSGLGSPLPEEEQARGTPGGFPHYPGPQTALRFRLPTKSLKLI